MVEPKGPEIEEGEVNLSAPQLVLSIPPHLRDDENQAHFPLPVLQIFGAVVKNRGHAQTQSV
jgi:hypothetical protein